MGMLMLIILSTPTFSQNDECENRNKKFRSDRDISIIQTVNEPFNIADIDTFQGLYYYPIDCNALLKGKIYKNDPMKVITVQTTKGQAVSVYDYGVVVVNLEGEEYNLQVYKNIDVPDFGSQETVFIPFKDMTSGNTTYEHGRYLPIEPKGSNVILDFNMATNPWENYNNIHSTLIVPASNVIQGPVPTGERKYEDR
jgi:hypothetical protein